MARINAGTKYILFFLNGPAPGLLLLFILVFLSSCKHESSDSLYYSDKFKPVLDSVASIADHNGEKGLKYLDSATKKIGKLNTADRFRFYALHFAIANKARLNPGKALLYADSMLSTVEQTSNKRFYANLFSEANFAKGDALFTLKRYNEAYGFYYNGYLIGKNNLNNCTLSSYTYRMGMISYKQAHFMLAVNYFKQSFIDGSGCEENFESFFRQQEVLDNIAISYKNADMPDSALVYFDKARQFIDAHSRQYAFKANLLDIARAVVYGNQAEVLNLKGDYKNAATLLTKSIAINEKKGNDNVDAELSRVKLGKIYLAHQQFDKLGDLLIVLRKQLDLVKNEDAEAGWNFLEGNYLRQKKDFAAAMPYMEKYYAIKDSIFERNKLLKASDLSEQLERIEKQYQIETLKARQRVYIYVALTLALMAGIIILLIYRNWKRSKEDLLTVSALNEQISEQKNSMELTLQTLKNSALEKDRILRTVAHDLRNPLGGIASLTNSMVDDAKDYNADQLELLKIIQETSYNSLELINEILEAANSTSTELSRQLVDINTLLSNSVELLRFKAAEKNQTITLTLLAEPEQLMISREKIWRVISNLISNAIKFSPTGGTIKVSIDLDSDDVLITVNDHGIGIPENMRDKVFNMFTDAKRPGTLGEKSFGLGLSICMQIVEKHGGSIWFESDKEQGTSFFVRLAREKANHLQPLSAQ